MCFNFIILIRVLASLLTFFCRIPNEKTPKDRLIAIVRYYLSAFHAARKVSE